MIVQHCSCVFIYNVYVYIYMYLRLLSNITPGFLGASLILDDRDLRWFWREEQNLGEQIEQSVVCFYLTEGSWDSSSLLFQIDRIRVLPFPSSLVFKEMYIWVSSAFQWYWILCLVITCGPRMEPWGTPQVIGAIEKEVFPMNTEEVQLFKYDFNQSSVMSLIPTRFSRRSNGMKYSIVYKSKKNPDVSTSFHFSDQFDFNYLLVAIETGWDVMIESCLWLDRQARMWAGI